MKIWVLTCGGYPHAWNEDVHALLKKMQNTFPDKRWQQLNELVWEMADGAWRLTQIERMDVQP